MDDFWDKVLTFAETTTTTVGSRLKEFGELAAVRKSDGSLVTEADKWADGEIRKAIATTFPDHGILTEETLHIFPDNDWCWIVDPIDGTTNFTRGIPIWGISLGLLYQGTPVFGFVHFPRLSQSFHGFWYGESGLTGPVGAFLNHKPISPSPDLPSNNHLFSLCARSIDVLKQPFPCKIRMVGVATYNYLSVASGATLGAVEATPRIWDIAAVWAIAQASGAVIVPLAGDVFPLQVNQNYGDRAFPTLVASRPELVSIFLPLVEFLKAKAK